MPIGLPGIVKARRNSRQPSESGEGNTANGSMSPSSSSSNIASTSNNTGTPNRHELMRRAIKTSTFEYDDASGSEWGPIDPLTGSPAVTRTASTTTAAGTAPTGGSLPSGSLLHPGPAISGAGQRAQQTAMRSPSGSTPGTPAPEAAAAFTSKLGPPGVVAPSSAAAPAGGQGAVAATAADSQASNIGDRPGDGSLTFESLDLASFGTNDIVHAEPHLQASTGAKQRPSTASATSESGGHAGHVSVATFASPAPASTGTPASKSAPSGLVVSPNGTKEPQTASRPELPSNSSLTSLTSPTKGSSLSRSPSKLRQTLSSRKSNNASSHGIAGALAASALTGVGASMGTNPIVTSPQGSLLSPPNTAGPSSSTPKRPAFSRTASGSNLSAHAHSHAREHSGATFIDHGTGSDGEDAVFAHEPGYGHRRLKQHDYADDEMSSDDAGRGGRREGSTSGAAFGLPHQRQPSNRSGRNVGDETLQRTSRQASTTSSLSNEGSFLSELSSASIGAGLGAAARFDTTAAAKALLPSHGGEPPLLRDGGSRRISSEATAVQGYSQANDATRDGTTSSLDSDSLVAALALASSTEQSGLGARTPGTPIPKPVLTPNGIGAVGGLSPSGRGEMLILDDEAARRQRQLNGGGAVVDPAEGRALGFPSQQYRPAQDPSYLTTSQSPPMVTGYAVASTKRNNAFHQLFSNVPEDDFLIEDYACALAREILVQGRLYVSENHLAFNANIFGWVTNVVVPFTDIVSIEKRMTAFVIPNAIQISTLHAKHTFTSFLSRDTAYDLIANIWRISHPHFTTNVDAMPDFSDDESVRDGPMSDKGAGDESQEQAPKNSKRQRLREKLHRGGKSGGGGAGSSRAPGGGGAQGTNGDTLADKDGEVAGPGPGTTSGGAGGASGAPKAKKAAHRPTMCSCERDKEHYSTVVLDAKYPAVPEKMYNMMFTSGFMKDFWQNNQKLLDLQMSDWSPDPENKNMLSRSMSYIKPLTASFGPKQTKCQITDQNLHVDFDDYVSMLTTTRTLDVPNGNIFAVKTKTCFTWAGGNVTRIYVTCAVEWTGRTMLKGIIEKASIDGQRQYFKELDGAIHAYLTAHASEFKEEGDDPIEDSASVDGPANSEGKVGAGEKGAEAGASGGAGEAGSSSNPNKSTSASTSRGKDGTSTGLLAPYTDMLTNAISDGLGMLTDAVSGASPSMLILSSVVVVLLLSNLWALTIREPPAGYRNVGSVRGGYGQHPSYGGYGYGQPPAVAGGGAANDAASDVVAAALREVLREHFGSTGTAPNPNQAQQPRDAATTTPSSSSSNAQDGKAGTVADRVEEIEKLMALIQDAESKIAKIKGDLPRRG